jgi:MSHA pilin protein MshD
VSLIELIMFIIIVGIALAGTLTVLNMTSAHSADPMVRKQMLTIAEALLEEAEMQPFTVCLPSDSNASTALLTSECSNIQGIGKGGASHRGDFNNVGNYCNDAGTTGTSCSSALTLDLGTSGSAASTIHDLTGIGLSSPSGYSATIQVIPEALNGITTAVSATALNANDVLRIKVTVNFYASGDSLVLEGYRTRWSPSL